MKVHIEVTLSPSEIPLCTEFFHVLRQITDSVATRNNTALFVQLAGAVTASVGAIVISRVGVKVKGTNPCFVGINVAVIKSGRGVVCDESTEMEMQDERIRVNARNIFFIVRTSSSALWIPPQGRWRSVLRKFRASISGPRAGCAVNDILQAYAFSNALRAKGRVFVYRWQGLPVRRGR